MDNREKGYTLFKKGLKYKEIAEKLGVPESTVKSWATRYWKKGKAASEKVATKKKKVATEDATSPSPPTRPRGAPKGNANGVGNKGGAPPGNQNAVIHGGYSAILFDTLDDTEHSMIDQMEPNEEQLLIDEINLLTIRERRIMLRIDKANKDKLAVYGTVRTERKRAFDTPEEKELYLEMVKKKVEKGERLPGQEYTTQTTTEGAYSIILKLEEALTRCQAQKQRAIDSLNKIRQAQGSKGGALTDDWISGVVGSMEMEDDMDD